MFCKSWHATFLTVTAHSEEAAVAELTAEPSDSTWQGLFGGVRRSDIKDPLAHESGI